jgi:DNA-directed RNA polymerase subunit RPC12/RpoP
MKLLKTYLYAHLAHLDIAKLADEDIKAVLKDENIVAIDPIYSHAVGGIKILVNDDDFDKALKVLDTNESNYLQQAFPEEIISEQIKCKKCGSINVFQKGSWIVGLFFLILAFIPFTTKRSKYVCLDCSHKWNE